jgi:putative peptide zinc metalloprotease protein
LPRITYSPKRDQAVSYRVTGSQPSAEPTAEPGHEQPSPAAEPEQGWRGLLFRLSRGAIAVQPGHLEARLRALEASAAAPIAGGGRIAVLSRKGGVGKSTIALMLGHALAERRDHVLALDCNPEAGSLAHRIRRTTRHHARELLEHEHELRCAADVRSFAHRAPSGLEVVATPEDPERYSALLDDDDVRRLLQLVEPHYEALCIDTGPNINHPATRAVLEAAEQVVVVVPPSIEGSRTAGATFEWLWANGHEELAARSVAVINAAAPPPPIDMHDLTTQLRPHCRRMIQVPYDSHLAVGGEVDPGRLGKATRLAFLELAAAVVEGLQPVSPGGRP